MSAAEHRDSVPAFVSHKSLAEDLMLARDNYARNDPSSVSSNTLHSVQIKVEEPDELEDDGVNEMDRVQDEDVAEYKYDSDTCDQEISDTDKQSHVSVNESFGGMSEMERVPRADDDKPYKCSECDKTFRRRHYLNRHKYVHNKKQFACDKCEKLFTRPDGFNRHKQVCTGYKHKPLQFACDVCNKQFTRPCHLNKHKNIHSRDGTLYECDVCHQTFGRPAAFTSHKRSHFDEKFACGICSQTFSRPGYVARHKLSKHTAAESADKLQYSCGVCNMQFKYLSYLETHKAVHTRDKASVCNMSNEAFGDFSALEQRNQTHSVSHFYDLQQDTDTRRYKHIMPSEAFNTHAKGIQEIDTPVSKHNIDAHCDLKQHIRIASPEKLNNSCEMEQQQEINIAQCEYNSDADSAKEPDVNEDEYVMSNSLLSVYSINIVGSQTSVGARDAEGTQEIDIAVSKYNMDTWDQEINNTSSDRTYAHDKLFHVGSDLVKHSSAHVDETLGGSFYTDAVENPTVEKTYECNECQRTFRHRFSLNRHRECVHKDVVKHNGTHTAEAVGGSCEMETVDKSYECSECHKSFRHRFSLNQHIKRTHSGSKPFVCPVCHRTFTQSSNLEQHQRTHTGDRPFRCYICDKTFAQSSSLVYHSLTHSGDKTHTCDNCGKAFSRSCDLLRHKLIHTGDKPYKCRLCPKAFRHIGTLHAHERIHNNSKPFVCDLCYKSFTMASSLYQHRHTHSVDQRYICNICGKKCSRFNDLVRHKSVHMDDRPLYKCGVCSKEFRHQRSLKRHGRVHSEQSNRPSQPMSIQDI